MVTFGEKEEKKDLLTLPLVTSFDLNAAPDSLLLSLHQGLVHVLAVFTDRYPLYSSSSLPPPLHLCQCLLSPPLLLAPLRVKDQPYNQNLTCLSSSSCMLACQASHKGRSSVCM